MDECISTLEGTRICVGKFGIKGSIADESLVLVAMSYEGLDDDEKLETVPVINQNSNNNYNEVSDTKSKSKDKEKRF